MTTTYTPVLPECAPFTAEQRAWLNGYLAGLYSWTPTTAASAPAPELQPLTVLYGSQTGGAEKAAKKLAKLAAARGYKPTLRDMGECTPGEIAAGQNLLVIASTYGDGEPPDRAREFWNALSNGAPRMESLRYSVLALGDSSYPKFCEFGRQLDTRLEELGASRVVARIDCDGDWSDVFEEWSAEALGNLGSADPTSAEQAEEEATGWERNNPFPSRLEENLRLSGAASAKDVRHFSLSLEGSGMTYACGDALGVWPENDPALVEEILTAARLDGDATVTGRRKQQVPLREALLRHFEITRLSPAMQHYAAEHCADAANTGAEWAAGRDVLDLLYALPQAEWTAPEFVRMMRELSPRLYSISSSPAAHGSSVQLTVSAVRYESHGRQRAGVCSTFLADRLSMGDAARIFVHENTAYRLPADDVPLIMIGPGTGIAPFRGFLHERRSRSAPGRNWLFSGDQHQATDFLYREEMEDFLADGTLARLDLAWSRDGAEKEYVQHRMLRHSREIWSWLEAGAAVYVCGDAQRMARDVDAALHSIVEVEGVLTPEEAAAFISQLKSQRRYQRDVY